MPMLNRLFYAALITAALGLPQAIIAAQPVTPAATSETRALYRNLHRLSRKGFLFGHQDANAYGHTWTGEAGRCDVKEVCGSYPAVYGFDFGEMTNPAYNDSTRRAAADRLRALIRDARSRGGVVTLCWHFTNPVGGKSFYFAQDSVAAVPMILPGGAHHDAFKATLRAIAQFAATLTYADGKLIPVIFRPWHEFDGDWFWWGTPHHCTREEFIDLFRFTVSYLRDTCAVRNLLYAISPDCKFTTEEEFEAHLPGDDYYDLLGMDNYWDLRPDGGSKSEFVRKLTMLSRIAQRHRKLAALTETGREGLPEQMWWTQTLLPLLRESRARLCYVLVWRNAYRSEKHYYAPFAGEPNSADFIRFHKDPQTFFEDDLPNLYR